MPGRHKPVPEPGTGLTREDEGGLTPDQGALNDDVGWAAYFATTDDSPVIQVGIPVSGTPL